MIKKIQDLMRESEHIWSLIFDGNQYIVQMEQDTFKPYVYIYNDVVGRYQLVPDSTIIEQIISQLDFEEMIEQDWLEEGEEPQDQDD